MSESSMLANVQALEDERRDRAARVESVRADVAGLEAGFATFADEISGYALHSMYDALCELRLAALCTPADVRRESHLKKALWVAEKFDARHLQELKNLAANQEAIEVLERAVEGLE
jgi:hypothetical protein